MSAVAETTPLPREDGYRAHIGLEFTRAKKDDGTLGMLRGYFVTWAERAEIDSPFEGHFIEQFERGAFKKTFSEQGDAMRMLIDHGADPQQGKRPIAGKFTELGENGRGATYEAPLLDTAFNRELLPGLEAGLYGASMRFRIIRAEEDINPGRSADNPDGIPVRTIKEAQVREVSVTAFPVYKDTSAEISIRCITDQVMITRALQDEGVRDAIAQAMLKPAEECLSRSCTRSEDEPVEDEKPTDEAEVEAPDDSNVEPPAESEVEPPADAPDDVDTGETGPPVEPVDKPDEEEPAADITVVDTSDNPPNQTEPVRGDRRYVLPGAQPGARRIRHDIPRLP